MKWHVTTSIMNSLHRAHNTKSDMFNIIYLILIYPHGTLDIGLGRILRSLYVLSRFPHKTNSLKLKLSCRETYNYFQSFMEKKGRKP